MTVKELIKELLNHDMHAEVVVYNPKTDIFETLNAVQSTHYHDVEIKFDE